MPVQKELERDGHGFAARVRAGGLAHSMQPFTRWKRLSTRPLNRRFMDDLFNENDGLALLAVVIP